MLLTIWTFSQVIGALVLLTMGYQKSSNGLEVVEPTPAPKSFLAQFKDDVSYRGTTGQIDNIGHIKISRKHTKDLKRLLGD